MDPLVDVEFVAGHLGDPDFVLLDATLPPVGVQPAPDVRAAYRERHLPGAVFFDMEALSDHETPLPHMLPAPASFAAAMSALGVGSSMTAVVYEQGDMFSAPRAWWTLRGFGMQQVYVLQGGLRAWILAGLKVESGPVERPQAPFVAQGQPETVCSLGELQAGLAAGSQVVDARSSGRFRGSAPEPRPGLRSGHMPGAVNVPYTELTNGGQMRSPDELRRVFASKGIDLQRPVTTTCGSGVTAAVVALALERVGAKQVRLYDGSWAEYAAQPGAEIATGDWP